jgi:glycosyltransferase involved in cell wall biosynthesis
MARQLAQNHRLDVRILIEGETGARDTATTPRTVRLADFGVHTIGNSRSRASALRMLMFALSDKHANIDIWPAEDTRHIVDAFADLGITVGVGSASAAPAAAPRHTARDRKLVFVPCRDWSLSGVHTVAEELGRELIARGWDFRILFTRGTIGVLDRTTEGRGLPSIPYEFLDTSRSHTPREHWAAIIRHLEWRAPCVVLSAFDDFANAVAPALSDDVGVVGWMQSDEDHYYESAYRLGRYWNALACVSRCILDQAGRLNPSFASRAHLIHNSTVRRDEIVAREDAADHCLRIAYVGRLVQYQKRVLDVVPLVHALERTRANYRMTLIGGAPDDTIERTLRSQLAPQLVTGKVRLPGPLTRPQVLQQLRAHDVCVLFSEFEGFPVSLVEAMSVGCIPAVPAALSGIPELVTHGDNGLIFQDRNYEQWAEALVSLSQQRDRADAMAARAQQTVSEHFTVESMADRFESVLSSVLEHIDERSWSRPPALTWKNALDDVLIPPALYGKPLD